jgi:hypothetical protein
MIFFTLAIPASVFYLAFFNMLTQALIFLEGEKTLKMHKTSGSLPEVLC